MNQSTDQESTLPKLACKGTTEYEELRTRFFNARVPDQWPSEIYYPRTTAEVAKIIASAKQRRLKVGVRSGGHLFPCTSLIQDGILIDTSELNRGIEYDAQTRTVCFPPGARVKELATALTTVGRFFPFGHSPTVGAGGFCLAGGQGWFMRGWGCTSDTWVTELEIVTASGTVVRASKTLEADLFWAARGSGQGFFGVVTRIWGRTIPSRRLFESTLVFDGTSAFDEVLNWFLETSNRTPKYGVDLAACTFRPDRDESGIDVDASRDTRLFIAVNIIAFADSLDEANALTSPWNAVPHRLSPFHLSTLSLQETTWEQLFLAQDTFTPAGHGERWQCDSILSDPASSRPKLIEAIRPALYHLPNRRSVGTVYVADYYPNEEDQVMSLPQQYYISTMTCWQDPSRDDSMRKWLREAYLQAASASCGQYIADFDSSQRITPVMSSGALQRFLSIRRKFDPTGMFVGHRGFSGELHEDTRL